MRVLPFILLLTVLPFVSACGPTGGGGSGAGGADDFPLYLIESNDISPFGALLDGRVPGLVRFSLEYLNGDHHVSTQRVGSLTTGAGGPDFDSFVLSLQDDDGADPVAMSAEFIDLQGITVREATSAGDLTGVAQLPIAQTQPGELLVLSGFSFVTDGTNHHIRVLRIDPKPELGYIEVEYRDDSPGDDLYFASVVYCIIPANRRVGLGLSPSFDGVFTQSFGFAGEDDRSRGIAQGMIHGFDLRFRTEDRHLEKVAVDLTGGGSMATFRDGDVSFTDDLVDFTVKYVTIHP